MDTRTIREEWNTNSQGFDYYKSVMASVLCCNIEQVDANDGLECASLLLCMLDENARRFDHVMRSLLEVPDPIHPYGFAQHFLPLCVTDPLINNLKSTGVFFVRDQRSEFHDDGSPSITVVCIGLILDHTHKKVAIARDFSGRQSLIHITKVKRPAMSEVN